MNKSVVIVSTGRTGTKFFAKLFSRYSSVRSLHDSPYTPLINILANMQLVHLFPRSLLIWIWQILKAKEIRSTSEEIYLDSNNHLYAFVFIAPLTYPDLHVIHIIRDPRTYVRSHLNWALGRKKSYLANFIIPFWQPNGFLLKELAWSRWFGFSRFERFCWIWKFKNSYILNEGKLCPDKFMVFRFEDFFNADVDRNQLEKLAAFVGVESEQIKAEEFSRPANSSADSGVDHWQHWSNLECAQMDAICGPLMKTFSYGLEPEWQEKVRMGYRELKPVG